MRIAVFYNDTQSMLDMNACIEELCAELPELISFRRSAPAHALRRTIKQETFDLILLTSEQPSKRLSTLVRWLKEFLGAPPYTLLTVDECDKESIIDALQAGIDDFVSLPIRKDEVRTRLLRFHCQHMQAMPPSRVSAAEQDVIRHGNISVDASAARVHRAGHPVLLTRQEFRLALLFLRNVGREVSRSYIYEYVWGREENPLSRSLDVHIYRLRKKLNLVEADGWSLTSIYGYGYLLRRLEQEHPATDEPAPMKHISFA